MNQIDKHYRRPGHWCGPAAEHRQDHKVKGNPPRRNVERREEKPARNCNQKTEKPGRIQRRYANRKSRTHPNCCQYERKYSMTFSGMSIGVLPVIDHRYPPCIPLSVVSAESIRVTNSRSDPTPPEEPDTTRRGISFPLVPPSGASARRRNQPPLQRYSR